MEGPGSADAPAFTVLYIGGLGRSGSTLLERILGEMPGFCALGEVVHLWERGLEGNERCGCGEPFGDCPFWRQVGRRAFGGWNDLDVTRIRALQRSVDRNRYIPAMWAPRLFSSYRHRLEEYAAVLGRLYRAAAECSGAAVIVDSTKHASTAFLLRRVPGVQLRVVHLVRDSRAVAYSWSKTVAKPETTQGEGYMARLGAGRVAMRWLGYNLLFHALALAGVPSLFMRYEDLVSTPRDQVARALALVGRRPGPMLDRTLDGGAAELSASHTVAGNPMRFERGRVAVRKDEEWRARLAAGPRRGVVALTWPLQLRYGYLRRSAATRGGSG